MSVRLAFVLAHHANALRIPVQALSFRLSADSTGATDSSHGLSPNELAMPDAAERAARTVWVMRGNREPEPVQIRIGITDNAFTEVTSGLAEGERVVIGKTTTGSKTKADGRAELAPGSMRTPRGSAPPSSVFSKTPPEKDDMNLSGHSADLRVEKELDDTCGAASNVRNKNQCGLRVR